MLEPIRHKRNFIKEADVLDILITGTGAAREVATKTLEEVRQAIGFRYFG